MDFITIRELRTEPRKVWKKLETEKELVITKNGKPFALLVQTQPNTLEVDLRLLRGLRAELALDEIRRRAHELGLDKMTEEEIDQEIAVAHKARHQKQSAASR
jgi:antitoxin (DNA-binding transcriptional repressor) of toxin-antitoxin stability system